MLPNERIRRALICLRETKTKATHIHTKKKDAVCKASTKPPPKPKRHSLTSQHEIRENQSDLASLTKKNVGSTLASSLTVMRKEEGRVPTHAKKKTHSPYREATQPYK